MKYYIYHIKGVKIGCTEQLDYRINKQGFSDYEILETHTDIYKASNRERELQKEYGYPVDKVPYFMSRKNWNKANKVASSKPRTKKQLQASSKVGKKTWKQNFKDVVKKRRSYAGEGNHKCRITEETAINILQDYLNEPNKYGLLIKLAKKYNTTRRTIQKIGLRETWKHI
jgi:hypothetical protein